MLLIYVSFDMGETIVDAQSPLLMCSESMLL